MRVRDIAKININNISSNTTFKEYKYLDTSNLTNNIVNQFQIYSDIKSLPSRAKRLVKAGDILISTVRPNQCHFGFMSNPDNNLVVSTGFTVVSPDENLVNGRYLYYFLTQSKITNYLQMIAESSVSSYPSITSEVIANIEINLPGKPTQDKIVNQLELLDKKLEVNLKLISELEEYSQLLFHKWFVDFNFPNENGEPYKDSGGEMVEVDGKMIPKGWKEVFVSYISDIQYGYPFNSEMFSDFSNENNHGVVRIRDIIENTISAYTSENVDSKYKLKFGDLLIGMDGNFHISNWYLEEAYLNQRVVRIRKSSIHNVSTLHIKHAISKQIKRMEKYISGTTVAHLSDKDIKKIKMLLSTDNVLEKFSNQMEIVNEKIGLLHQQNKSLVEMRDLLINKFIK